MVASIFRETVPLPELLPVPGCTFVMGRDGGSSDEAPAHGVTVPSFLAAVTPVTNRQYARFLEQCPSAPPPPPFWSDAGFSVPEQPVVGVNWFEAIAYCDWLATRSGRACRLPTEAERELAARGGRMQGDWPWEGAQHPIAAVIDACSAPHPPRTECANGFGLRCMAENVHEWCSDWYAAGYYAHAPSLDPRGPDHGTRRASRGGSWRHRLKTTRVNARSSLAPELRYADFGFRVYADA